MKNLALALSLIFATTLCAQEVRSFKQHNMGRWGIPAGNYSGIAHIDADRYALVSDKQDSDGWTEVKISFLPSGDIDEMQFVAHYYDEGTRSKARDSEGIVCVSGQGFFVCAENDQQILELAADGMPTGRKVAVPECFATSNIFPNYGFEALTYDSIDGTLWTTTEQGVRTDVEAQTSPNSPTPTFSLSHKSRVKLVSAMPWRENASLKGTLLRLQAFSASLQPLRQYAYRTEQPRTRKATRAFAFGVPELLAVNDTTLIVMEREIYIPKRYNGAKCHIRLFCVNPHAVEALKDTSVPLSEIDDSCFLTKKLLYEFHTGLNLFGRKDFANYEGMCLGPKLDDGRQVVLLVADSQNHAGNRFFRLKDYIKVLVVKP